VTEAPGLRALTIFQPMAWAVAAGLKRTENRHSDLGYRGPLAIHAGAEVKERWLEYPSIQGAIAEYKRSHGGIAPEFVKRSIIGVCLVVGAHPADGECCKPWGLSTGWHLELTGAVELRRPISMRGQQGLWAPPPDTAEFLLSQL
jgi:hypothetical protein